MVDALVARGDEVVVLDDLSTGKRENLDGAFAAGATLVEGNITDEAAVAEAFDRAPPGASSATSPLRSTSAGRSATRL